jgi:hypothetical protein
MGDNFEQIEGPDRVRASSARKLGEQQSRRLGWPIMVIFLLPLLMFGRAFQPGRVFSAADNLFLSYPWKALEPGAVPQNALLGDRAFVFEPWLIYASAQIRSGFLPLWNTHAYAGAPLLGNSQSALLFPLTALAYAVPVETALGLAAILKMETAGLSMYWMLQLFRLEPLAAASGALAFMFSGCMIVWLGWPITNVAIWIPLLVGLTELLRETGAWRYGGWLAVVMGVQFLGGHPETSFFIVVLIVCYALHCARSSGWHFVVQFVVAGTTGLLLAAVQLLPFFHYLAHSSVSYYRHQAHGLTGLPPHAFMALLIPNYFGNPVSKNFWGPGNYNTINGSAGLLPWILAPIALVGGWYRRETKFFFGAAMLLGLLLYNVPPLPWLVSKLPAFSAAVNRRSMVLLAFSLAALCGIGMHILMNPPPAARLRMVNSVKLVELLLLTTVAAYLIVDVRTIGQRHLIIYVAVQVGAFVLLLAAGSSAAVYALRQCTGNTALGILLLTIELLSVLSFASSYNPIIRISEFYPITPALKYLQSDRDLFRVLLPVPNVGAVYGLSDIAGYDGMTPRVVEQLVGAGNSPGPAGTAAVQFTESLKSEITDLVNLKYVLLPPGAPSPGSKFKLVYDGTDGRIYQNNNVFPRAFLITNALSCLDDNSALALIRAGNIDLRREVIISGCRQVNSGGSSSGSLMIDEYGPQQITVRADVRSHAFLVLTDTYDSDWHVWVDGRQVPLLRADFAFRAVALVPGSHKVRFLYRPLTFILGLVLSTTALLGAVALIWFGDRGSG